MILKCDHDQVKIGTLTKQHKIIYESYNTVAKLPYAVLLFAIMDTYLIHTQLYVSNTKINYSVKPQ